MVGCISLLRWNIVIVMFCHSRWMVVHSQDDLLGFVSEIIVSIQEVKPCILSLCLLNINLGIFNLEMAGQWITLSEKFVNYQNTIFSSKWNILKYFQTFCAVQVNLVIGGFPEAFMLMEMSSPSITVKLPWEEWNSGPTGKYFWINCRNIKYLMFRNIIVKTFNPK